MKHISIKMQDWEAAMALVGVPSEPTGGSEVRDDKAAQATQYPNRIAEVF